VITSCVPPLRYVTTEMVMVFSSLCFPMSDTAMFGV